MPNPLETGLRTLAVDAASVRVAGLLRAAGVRSLLLKGGALRAWLYADGTARAYGDIDLLVAPGDVATATAALLERGWTAWPYPSPTGHADKLVPPPGEPPFALDLHRTFHHVTVAPDRAWGLLSARAVPLRLGASELETLDAAGLAVIVALHHVNHGEKSGKSGEDLRRAVASAAAADWREAAALAEALGALAAFSAGVRSVAGGPELAAALELPRPSDPALALSVGAAPRTSAALLRAWVALRRPRELARIVGRAAVPAPIVMREHYPLARRGAAGLALAYLVRPLRLAPELPRGLRAAAAARRAAHRDG
jgi:hypothetical protein